MSRSADRDAAFVQYVAARRGQLRRAAYLLTGDWSTAEDLVQMTLTKVYVAWARVDTGSPEGYVRRTMLHAFLDDQRRPWTRETSRAEVPDRPTPETTEIEETAALRHALNNLSARQRATVVLRHWYGLSVAETAMELNCSVGTVKSQTARALAALRLDLSHTGPLPETSRGNQTVGHTSPAAGDVVAWAPVPRRPT